MTTNIKTLDSQYIANTYSRYPLSSSFPSLPLLILTYKAIDKTIIITIKNKYAIFLYFFKFLKPPFSIFSSIYIFILVYSLYNFFFIFYTNINRFFRRLK